MNPREWIIVNNSKLAIAKGSAAWDMNVRSGEEIHVIEKAAYDRVVAERDMWVTKYHEACNQLEEQSRWSGPDHA